MTSHSTSGMYYHNKNTQKMALFPAIEKGIGGTEKVNNTQKNKTKPLSWITAKNTIIIIVNDLHTRTLTNKNMLVLEVF